MSSVERHLHFEDALYLLKGGGEDCSCRLEREGMFIYLVPADEYPRPDARRGQSLRSNGPVPGLHRTEDIHQRGCTVGSLPVGHP